MNRPRYSKRIALEYVTLFETAQIPPYHLPEVTRMVETCVSSKDKYLEVANALKMPWYVIASLHMMECGFDFSKHLHNGDSLAKKTVRVPKNRPKNGTPPFQWNESALDALESFANLSWTLPEILWRCESYNGLGYRMYHSEVNTPYLWSGTQHYTSGKYVGDGEWSSTAVSKQIGIVALLRRLLELKHIETPQCLVSGRDVKVVFSPEPELYGKRLQTFLNSFPGISICTDGIPYRQTGDAFIKVFGKPMCGDDRTPEEVNRIRESSFPGFPLMLCDGKFNPWVCIIQKYLNSFADCWVSVDGIFGDKTRDEFKRIHDVEITSISTDFMRA